MSSDKRYFQEKFGFPNIFKVIKYKTLFSKDNPNYFYPAGIWCFCGPQGSGKTLSAVRLVKRLVKEYPNVILVTNLEIHNLPECRDVFEFTDYNQILSMSNGTDGIIFFIDEIHTLWSSLESKDIPISEIAAFSQMRKDRRVIIGTSQKFGRIAKPIREQMQYAVVCKNYLDCFQYNKVVDAFDAEEVEGKLTGNIITKQIFFHSVDDYNSYDTLFKIQRLNRKEVKK